MRIAITTTLLLVTFSFTNVVSARDHIPLTIVTEHLPPYQIVDEQGHISGFATELIEMLMSNVDIDYRHAAYSWTRSYNLAKTQKNTCIYSIARIPSREKLFHWIGSLTETHAVIYANKKNRNIIINEVADAKNYVIAVIRDDVTHLALQERGFEENKNLYVIDNTKSLAALLIHKKEIDLIVADDITLPYRAEIANVDISQIKRMIEIEDLPLNFYLACHPNTEGDILQKLKVELARLKASKDYRMVLKRWQYNIPAASN